MFVPVTPEIVNDTPWTDWQKLEAEAGGVPGCECLDCREIRTKVVQNEVRRQVSLGKCENFFTNGLVVNLDSEIQTPYWNRSGRGLKGHPIWRELGVRESRT